MDAYLRHSWGMVRYTSLLFSVLLFLAIPGGWAEQLGEKNTQSQNNMPTVRIAPSIDAINEDVPTNLTRVFV